ncbi:SGNH/GDSL hydrolase family protein [Neorhizobium sp. NCHU2750]|uniref:SGNH/GDSL hydrolase family protein n=1 Tax=Neorhizobium sp. NCHU2750 TaxID=1825976 RepID=UPI000E741969|nr:hypothetical protein NCHU2750_15160 [Neorhizobium sp. NCHU2750]
MEFNLGFGFTSLGLLKPIGGAIIPPITTGIIAANRFQIPTATASVPANYTSRRSHFAHPDGDISNLKTVDANFVYSGTTAVAAATRTIKRFIEYPAGVFTAVTWGGSPTVTLSTLNVVSDPINLTIPKGAEFWERTVNLNASVGSFPCQELPASSQALGVPDGNSASDLGNSGTISATSAITTFGASVIIGDVAAPAAKSFVILGDSIAFGEGDITSVGAKRGSGWIARALDNYGHAYLKITKPGQQVTEFVSTISYPTAFLALINFSDVISEHGINDLRLGRTQAQILADHQSIYSMVSGKRIAQTTMTPRSSSTDGYATVANQTGRTDGTMASIVPLNAAIRAKPANVNRIIEAADAAASARDSLVWASPPVPTADGTHPNSFKADQMAQILASQVAGPITGIDPETLLRPLSYVKAIGNEYNSGQGLGSANPAVGGTVHGVAYEDITDGSFQVWFPHYGASAGYGEWSTGGTMTIEASIKWIDASGAQQITILQTKAGGGVASAAAFQDAKLYGPTVRPKVGSHFWINFRGTFPNGCYYSHARADYANGEALQYGSTVPNLIGSATAYGNTWNGGGDFYGPSFIGGKIARPTFGVSGDSNHSGVLVNGICDVPDTLQGGIGSVARLLTPYMAGIDVSVPGGTAFEMSDPTKTACRDRLLNMTDNVFYPLGTNDMIFNTYTAVQVDGFVETAKARHKNKTYFYPTIPAVVTSNSANTVYNSARDVERRSRNTTLRSRSNVVDIAVGTESTVTPGTLITLTDTIDGTHFNATGNKKNANGANFNVSSKISGANSVNAGYQYPSGAIYQNLPLTGFSGQQATITTSAIYSPEHKLTGALLVEDTSTNSHSAFVTSSVTVAETTRVFTICAKRVSGARNLFFQIQKNGGNYADARAVVNLDTGTLNYSSGESGVQTVNSVTVTAFEDYWKVSLSVTFAAGVPANPYIFVKIANATGNDNYAGDGASSIAVWGLDIR